LSFILYTIGLFISGISILMMFVAIIDFLFLSGHGVHIFSIASFVIMFFGGMLILACDNFRDSYDPLNMRSVFILTSLSWLFITIISAIPFYFDGSFSLTDALFESVSCLTTTGSSIINHPEKHFKSLLLWRSMLQWIGGIGIIMMAMSIMPFLKIGGMNLVRSEFSDHSEKIVSKVSTIAFYIFSVYMFFTVSCILSLYFAGMNLFDSICHAMVTISSGGTSNYTLSISHFQSKTIEIITMIFMFFSGVSFLFFVKLWKGNFKDALNDRQVRLYMKISFFSPFGLAYYRWIDNQGDFLQLLHETSFAVVSHASSTGFFLSDYSKWGTFPIIILTIMGILGGCSGSTCGGIKLFRIQILWEISKQHIRKIVYPHGVFFARESNAVLSSVLTFVVLWVMTFVAIVIGLSLCGLDIVTSCSGAFGSISNFGVGSGNVIGPSGDYVSLSSASKWILMSGMIMGRLEIITVISVFMFIIGKR
jgi:trk system potassium uptake protein